MLRCHPLKLHRWPARPASTTRHYASGSDGERRSGSASASSSGDPQLPNAPPAFVGGSNDIAKPNVTPSKSRRAQKRRRPSSTAALVKTLRTHHLHHAIPRQIYNKQDLSYSHGGISDNKRGIRCRTSQDFEDVESPSARLPGVVACYIESFAQRFPGAYHNSVSDEAEQEFLKSIPSYPELRDAGYTITQKGYTWEDVHVWQSILVTRDDVAAAEQVLASATQADRCQRMEPGVPLSVVLFFLRRPRLQPDTLRKILIYVWHLAGDNGGETQSRPPSDAAGLSNVVEECCLARMNSMAVTVLVIRLLRHARQALPEALVSVGRILLTAYRLGHYQGSSTRSRRRSSPSIKARATVLFNRVLSLLSLPTSQYPFHSVKFMQQAQFEIVAFMASQNPVIAITREGYQAICRVQLANKKTTRERDWASLKVRTWPPWKEDKIGFDAEKGPEYGVSQAYEAIQRAQEAGYGSKAWETTATILAGWDIDHSPTIQTRTFQLRNSNLARRSAVSRWIARIRATRTIQEAWACFLSYQEQTKSRRLLNQRVYLAILEKLYREQEKVKRYGLGHQPSESQLSDYGGDSKEPLIVSTSPKEQTYVRTSPPSVDELAEQMHAEGSAPRNNCLAFLVANADTFQNGIKYLAWARTTHSIETLLDADPEYATSLPQIPPLILDAFIKLLCRFPLQKEGKYLRQGAALRRKPTFILREPPVSLAYAFLKSSRSDRYSSWHALIVGMLKTRFPQQDPETLDADIALENIERWHMLRGVKQTMSGLCGVAFDNHMFILFSRALGKAATSAHDIVALAEQTSANRSDGVIPFININSHMLESAKNLLDTGRNEAKEMFTRIFGNLSEPTTYSIPALLSVPYAPILHVHVRSLGLLRDWEGLQEFASWMCRHRIQINEAIEMPANGPRMLRRTLVAIRAFLESPHMPVYLDSNHNVAEELASTGPSVESKLDVSGQATKTIYSRESSPTADSPSAPSKVTSAVRALVEGIDEWGGWPTDDEVLQYREWMTLDSDLQGGIIGPK